MKATRILTPGVSTSATESPLRSPDQLVPGVLLAGGGFHNIWLVVAKNGDELDMQRMPLMTATPTSCIQGNHNFKSEGFTFGRRCKDCGFLRTRIVVDQPLGLVVTVGPPAAYVISPPTNFTTPERGVVYSNGSLFFTPTPDAEGNLVWGKQQLPLVPDLFVAWEVPAYWRDKL